MVVRTYTTTTASKSVHVDENGLDEWGLPHGTRVKTSQGMGRIMGSFDNDVFVLLDTNESTKQVTIFHLEDIGDTVTTDSSEPPPTVKTHPLKLISYKGEMVRIVMQRKAGPCPIFAIANALALRGNITLLPDIGASIRETTLNKTLSDYFRSTVSDLAPPSPSPSPDTATATAGGPSTTGSAQAAAAPSTEIQKSNDVPSQANQDRGSRMVSAQVSAATEVVPSLSMESNPSIAAPSPAAVCTSPSETTQTGETELQGTVRTSIEHEKASVNTENKIENENVVSRATSSFIGAAGPKENTLNHFLSDSHAVEKLKREFASSSEMDNFISSLYAGMDVDVVFSGVEEFMMDRCIALFPLFGLRIFHGWVIGECMAPYERLQFFSYNDLTTAAVTSPLSETQRNNDGESEDVLGCRDSVQERNDRIEVISLSRDFYNTTSAHQMTTDGFLVLREVVPESEISVLFWQNHFFTFTKDSSGQLLVLLTDESYLHRTSFVFASISHFALEDFFDGDGRPVDKYVAHVTANAGDDYSPDQIEKMRVALQGRNGISPTPEQVLAELILEKSKSTKGHVLTGILKKTEPSVSQSGSGKKQSISEKEKENAVHKFMDILGSDDASTAHHFLIQSNYNVESAIDKYFQTN